MLKLEGLLLQVSVRWQQLGPKHQALQDCQPKPERPERQRQQGWRMQLGELVPKLLPVQMLPVH